MNIKRVFGSLLTLLGIAGLIYMSIVFVNTTSNAREIKAIIIFGILGMVFFLSGISLVRNIKDE